VTTLVARSRWLATAPTLLGGDTVFFDDHAGLAGYGIADEITVTLTDPESAPTLATRLREIEHDNEVGVAGSGPVSFMALPFAAARSGTAHIPQVILGRTRDSKGWVTTVAPANAASGSLDTLVEQALRATNATAADPQRFTLAPRVSHEQWRAVVERALGEIANGRLDKVVLARALDIEADRPFPLENVMARLARLHPSCLRFAVDGFVGASPELLLRKRGDTIQSTPLAGTTGRTGDPEADAEAGTTLLSSAKERREHVFVTEQLRASLDTIATDIVVGEPELHSFRNVMHLGTRITARSAAISWLRCTPRPPWPGRRRARRWASSRPTNHTIAVVTQAPSGGSTRRATRRSPSVFVPPSSTAPARRCGPAWESSPGRIPTPNSPKRS
jgi:menaquinone-specific isochorismate synthase